MGLEAEGGTAEEAITEEPTSKDPQAEQTQAQSDDPSRPLLWQDGQRSTSEGSEASAAVQSTTTPTAKFEIEVSGWKGVMATTCLQSVQLERGTAELLVQSAIDEASVIKRVSLRLLPTFFCLGMLCTIDRANLSFAALQLNHDLHFSDSVYGFGSGVFFIGYAVFAVPSTFVCARIGAPLFLGSALIVWGLVASLFSAMRKSWQFYVLRLVLGLAESGAYPGIWYHLALFYSDREMVVAYTVVSTASALSGVLGAPIAAGLLRMDGLLSLRGWQWLFLLEGFPAMLLGIAVLTLLARSPEDATFLSIEERVWLSRRAHSRDPREQTRALPMAHEPAKTRPKTIQEAYQVWCHDRREKDQLMKSSVAAPNQRSSTRGPLVKMLREWRIWYLAIIWSIMSIGLDTLNFWLPLVIKAIIYGEGSESQESDSAVERETLTGRSVHTALLSSIPFTSAAIGMVAIAWLSKRSGERHWHTALPLFIGSVAISIIPIVERQVKWLALALLTVGTVGIWGPHGPLLTWPAALLDGTAAASGFALIKMIGAFAAFGGNAAMGELHENTGSFAIPMFLLAGVLSVGGILALLFQEPGQRQALDAKQLISRLQNRMGLKRSRSDPASLYPKRTFSGTMSTIREDIARPDHSSGTPRFEMPYLQPYLEGTPQGDERGAYSLALHAV